MKFFKFNHFGNSYLSLLSVMIFVLTGCNDSGGIPKSPELIVIPKGELKIESEKLNRFQMMNNPTAVIDTHTGEVWRATSSIGGQYYFIRMCYKLNEVGLAPTPSIFWKASDSAGFKQECSGK